MSKFSFTFFFVTSLISSNASFGNCWQEAGKRYGIDPWLLFSIAQKESSLQSSAINRNRDGSYDVGLMQINSLWLKQLKAYGIDEKSLKDPCISINVGAWVLAQNIARHGNNWEAIGAYNAGSSKKNKVLRERYANKIIAQFNANTSNKLRLSSQKRGTPTSEIAAVRVTEE